MKIKLGLLVLFGLHYTIVAVSAKPAEAVNPTPEDDGNKVEEDEYYDDEEETHSSPPLKPLLEPVTCPKNWYSWVGFTSECVSKCAKQGGVPNCCDFDGPLYKCQCIPSLVLGGGGGGLSDLVSPSKIWSTFTTNMACGVTNLKNFGKSVVP